MKEKAIISPIVAEGKPFPTTTLKCCTSINGTWWTLTENFELMSDSDAKKNGKRMLTYLFNNNTRSVTIEYETKDKEKPELLKDGSNRYIIDQIILENLQNKQKRDSIKQFFALHSQILFKCNKKPGSLITATGKNEHLNTTPSFGVRSPRFL